MAVTFTNFRGDAGSAATGTTVTTIYTVPAGKVAKISFKETSLAGELQTNAVSVARPVADADSIYDTSASLMVGGDEMMHASSINDSTIASVSGSIDPFYSGVNQVSKLNRTSSARRQGGTYYTASADYLDPILTAGETIVATSVRGTGVSTVPTIYYNFMVIEDDA